MSAITAVHAIQRSNPPLEYNKKAIREHLQHHATNGPAHVQIQATKALARMIGLYEDAKQGINQAVDQAKDAGTNLAARVTGLMNGTLKPTEKELAHFKLDKPLDEDEEAANKDDDEVP